jgi:hypothetical protein
MDEVQPQADTGPLDPIERLTAALAPEEEQPETQQELSDQETDEVDDVVEAVEDGELDDAVEDEEVEEVEEDQAETEEEETEETEETEQTFEVDGQKVGLEELKLGYLRQADYTKKTQAIAEQRKTFEENEKVYTSSLQALLTAAGADLGRFENVNWEQAAVENPDQYKQAKALYEQTRQTYDFIRQQADSHRQRIEEQTQAIIKQRASESLSILKSSIPNWSNDLYYKIGEYAKDSLGVTADEFRNISDHRSITAMWKAMQFDQARQVSSSKAKKAVKASPTKTLSGSATVSKKAQNQETYRKSRDRLKKTGSMDDAVAALLNRR